MFSWIKLFDNGEQPDKIYIDSLLGEMIWSEDHESWNGVVNGINCWIAYELESSPKQGTVDYAISVLFDDSWLNDTLESAKEKALQLYSSDYEKEIRELKFVTFSFQSENKILIQFFEDDDQPWWNADIEGKKLIGIGLDT